MVSPGQRSLPATRATLAFASRIGLVELGRSKTHAQILSEHGLGASPEELRAAAAAATAQRDSSGLAAAGAGPDLGSGTAMEALIRGDGGYEEYDDNDVVCTSLTA